jgi:hypothetical protein
MQVMICRRLEFKWGLYNSTYSYITFDILSITLHILYIYEMLNSKGLISSDLRETIYH